MRYETMLRMQRIALVLVIPFLVGPGVGHKAGAESAVAAVDPKAIEAHIRFLADDLMLGRETGSREYEIAARYVAAQFALIGVLPAGEEGYLQAVPLRRSMLELSSPRFTLFGPNGETELRFREDFLTDAAIVRERVDVRAPLVFVGYGIVAPELDHDDYRNLDVNGKIVVALSGKPSSFPSELGAHVASSREKERYAAERGAVGLVSVVTPTREKVFPFARMAEFLRLPRMSWLDGDTPANTYEKLSGEAIVSLDAAPKLFRLAPRPFEDVLASIEKEDSPLGFDLGLEGRIEARSRHEAISSSNVVGLVRGSDPSLQNEFVVYTAHLDHDGPSSGPAEDVIYNGALDNASGVAILLETARLFASAPKPPRRSILFAVVTGEERGLLGADYFARNPTVPRDRIVADVNLDMPLILYPLGDVIAFGAEHSSLGDVVGRAARAVGLELSPDPFPEQGIFTRSDHYMFVKQGIPSVFLVPGFHSSDPNVDGGAIFSNFLQQHYHQPSDEPDLPIDYDAGALFTRVNYLIGLEVANAAERPTWNPGDYFGRTFGRESR
jgi:hypothetical protein